jgi:23S rRNA (pseudouridine1915-N3)-methyltransferase
VKIRLISVGKIKEKYYKAIQDEYLKMLSRFCTTEIIEVQDEKIPVDPSERDIEIILEKERERIERHILKNSTMIVLAIEGEQTDSVSFSGMLKNEQDHSRDITFIIGGSLGLAEALKKSADKKMSFSKMTFPHRLARILLLEQMFRGFKIINNETYHK